MEQTIPMAEFSPRLTELYETYIREVAAFFQAQKFQLNDLMSGKGRYRDCPLNEQLLTDVDALVAQAAVAPATADDAARMLEYMLLTTHTEQDHPAYWMLIAAEGRAVPLLALPGRETLAELFARYRKRLRRRGALPVQKTVLKTMKERLRSGT